MKRLPALPHPLEIKWRAIETGYWMLYLRRGAVLVPARIFICNHEPYNPDNKRDRWPEEHLAGEIAGRWVEPWEIWERVLLRETRPNHWRCAHPLIPKEDLTVEQEYEFQMKDMAWIKEHGVTNPLAKPHKPVKLGSLPLPF